MPVVTKGAAWFSWPAESVGWGHPGCEGRGCR